MTQLLLVLTPIGLLDAISIAPLASVPLLAILGGRARLRNSLALILGLFVPYMGLGVILLLGLSTIIGAVNARFEQWLHDPDALDMMLQLGVGLVMLSFGFKLERSRENEDDRGAGEDIGLGQAFSVGFVLTLVGLPGALPYFAAISEILRADLDVAGSLLALGWYNVVCSLPLWAIVVLRIVLGERSDAVFRALGAFLTRWSHRIIVTGLIVLGFLLVIDAMSWMKGQPLIKL